MENSSRALIMAGEILIAILVIGIIVFLITKFGSFSASVNDNIAEDKVSGFNNNFYKFDGKADITAEEIATLIDFAKHNNDDYNLEVNSTRDQYVRIMIDGRDFFDSQAKDAAGSLITFTYKNNSEFTAAVHKFIKSYNLTLFKCNVKTAAIEELTDDEKAKYGVNYNVKISEYKDDDIKANNRTGLVTYINFSQSKINNATLGISFNVKNREDFLVNMVK